MTDNDCPICYNKMDDPYTNPCCKNKFHVECLSKWYDKARSCPCCRSKDIRTGPFASLAPIEIRPTIGTPLNVDTAGLINAWIVSLETRYTASRIASQAARDATREAARRTIQAMKDARKEAEIAKIQEKARLVAEKAAKKEATRVANAEAKEAAKLAKKEAKEAAKLAKTTAAIAAIADPITMAGQAAMRRAVMV